MPVELWKSYREDDELNDFMAYNDLGLLLAYLLASEMVLPTSRAKIVAIHAQDCDCRDCANYCFLLQDEETEVMGTQRLTLVSPRV